ncbi:MAG: hypothetical protein M3R15_12485 [Acidobacteriota bacterium]|nr:hypothetical protein [Acidobacteriota bacterium]
MIYRGVIRGKTIELENPLPYPEGQAVSVSVEPLTTQLHPSSPAAVRQVMHEPPHLTWEDVDELERAIEEGKLPMHQEGVFDEIGGR